jgi:hypothetical protein
VKIKGEMEKQTTRKETGSCAGRINERAKGCDGKTHKRTA